MSGVAADTHVHIYPCHDVGRLLAAATRRRRESAADRIILCLTERYDCHAFRHLADGSLRVSGWTAESPEPGSLIFRNGSDEVVLLAGRQIVSRERIEVLALTVDATITDGLPVRDVLVAVQDVGAVPVLPWSPGKWLGNRGQIISALIDSAGAGTVLLGDTSMRPVGYPMPDLIKAGRRKGLGVVAGSDPLPFAGEEARAGQFMSMWGNGFDIARPVVSMRQLLRRHGVDAVSVGARSSLPSVVLRIVRNSKSKGV